MFAPKSFDLISAEFDPICDELLVLIKTVQYDWTTRGTQQQFAKGKCQVS